MKRLILPTIVSIFMISVYISGCQRDVQTPDGWNNNSNAGVDDNIKVVGGIRGIVIDENNQPVAGAAVVSGTGSTTTDNYGAFSFNNINISKNNGYVKVTKPGYFLGARSFVASAGRIHNVRIRLLPKSNTGVFASATGGTVSLSSGVKLVMPAAAVTDASGNAYNGSVNVAMAWIDPTAPNLPEIMMGDLRGITTSGEERGLETFGMLGVELTGSGNQPLKMAAGKTAELTFPIPASIAGNAPATIDLWHFDEVKGRWIQEGTATKTGSNYVANVSHFSFWNCDAPFPLVNLCMTIVNASNNQPLNNIHVRIKRPNGSYGHGRTDSVGRLCGKIPKNEALVLEVLTNCYTVAYSQNIGPFSQDADLGTISVTVPNNNSLVISGTLTNCTGGNVTNGAVVIRAQGSHAYYVPVSNGSFSLNLVVCGTTTTNFTVQGVDYATLKQSAVVSGTGTTGLVNVGTIQACAAPIDEYTEFIIDGVNYLWMFPPDGFGSMDSTTTGLYSNLTGFQGSKGGAGTNTWIGEFNIVFRNNAVPGTYPITNTLFRWNPSNMLSTQFQSPNPVINIKTIGTTVNSVIEGNFNQVMIFPSGPKNVQCNFRVRRN